MWTGGNVQNFVDVFIASFLGNLLLCIGDTFDIMQCILLNNPYFGQWDVYSPDLC